MCLISRCDFYRRFTNEETESQEMKNFLRVTQPVNGKAKIQIKWLGLESVLISSPLTQDGTGQSDPDQGPERKSRESHRSLSNLRTGPGLTDKPCG